MAYCVEEKVWVRAPFISSLQVRRVNRPTHSCRLSSWDRRMEQHWTGCKWKTVWTSDLSLLGLVYAVAVSMTKAGLMQGFLIVKSNEALPEVSVRSFHGANGQMPLCRLDQFNVSQCCPKGRGVVGRWAELLRNEWKKEIEWSGKVTSSNIENTQALND